MPSTFDTVANIISETCDIPRDTIKPESHAINDLGIDSLDFLDIAFAIDKAFGIKLPLEQWTQDVNDGKATTEQYFVLDNLCASIDSLVAAKMAKATSRKSRLSMPRSLMAWLSGVIFSRSISQVSAMIPATVSNVDAIPQPLGKTGPLSSQPLPGKGAGGWLARV